MTDAQAKKQLLVLVGPKGSGKTTLGRMLENRLGACFVHVERVAQRVLAESGGVIDERYARCAFDAILSTIEEQAAHNDLMVIESTAASEETSAFFAALRQRYEVFFIRVHAQRSTCDARIAARDPVHQVDVPKELLARMYERSIARSLPWDLELDNDSGIDARTLADAVRPLLHPNSRTRTRDANRLSSHRR